MEKDLLPPDITYRINGLTRHLKGNSCFEERQRQVLEAPMESLIPEEYDETLFNEFERRCAYGERMNTELMSSSKWVKMLKEVGVISTEACGKGTMSLADADIIFRKVLHHSEHCGKRLTYEPFCKALFLAAIAARPDLELEAALVEMLARVASAAPEESKQPKETADYMLDANVLLVLDRFKSQLWDLFKSFCGRNLGNVAGPTAGHGTVRLRERTFWKHTQDTLLTSRRGRSCSPTRGQGLIGLSKFHDAPSPCCTTKARDEGFMTPPRTERRSASPPHSWIPNDRTCLGSPASGSPLSGSPSLQRIGLGGLSLSCSGMSGNSAMSPYEYMNGAPVIKNRRRHMSLDQLLSLCKDLKIVPEHLSRLKVMHIFKRAQSAGLHAHGSSIYSFLTHEAFVDAIGQIAIEAYSKEPYCNEFPALHDRIHWFFFRFLPGKTTDAHDRMHYGVSSRGR